MRQSFDGFIMPTKDSVSGSNIKSIQRGSTALSGTTNNVPISAVYLNKSIAIITFENNQATSLDYWTAAQLTSSTNLQLLVNRWISQTLIVKWQVIEFNNVKSLQRGIKLLPAASLSITQSITSVDTSKSVLFMSLTNDGTEYGNQCPDGTITDSTTLTFSRGTSTGNATIYWQVIEFN